MTTNNQSILIFGQYNTGKTTRLKQLLKTEPTEFTLDGATNIADIIIISKQAELCDSFCIVTTQINIKNIPASVLSKFQIIDLNNTILKEETNA
jgi:GTPase SAR1 family protein